MKRVSYFTDVKLKVTERLGIITAVYFGLCDREKCNDGWLVDHEDRHRLGSLLRVSGPNPNSDEQENPNDPLHVGQSTPHFGSTSIIRL
jgi:hypothetical protein